MNQLIRNLTSEERKIHYLFFAIIILIGFQQFPVIRIGGSFKIYEFLSIIVIFKIIFGKFHLYHGIRIRLFSFLFFIVSPLLSYLVSLIAIPFPYKFFIYYPHANSFKFNYYFFPFLQLIYMLFNYTTMIGIINTKSLYDNFEKVVRATLIIGTIIALYSLYAMFFNDPIADLPSFIQNKKKYILRTVGMSQEPSFYVLYQSWIFLFAVYSKKVFKYYFVWLFILAINFLSLVFTQSTTLLSLFFIFLLSIFLLRNSLKVRLGVIFSLVIFIASIYIFLIKFNYYDTYTANFVEKSNQFFISPNTTIGSGGFRNYTGRIGIEIFKKNYMTGVGVGNSIYHMFPYEYKMGIVIFGERIFPGSFPQNLFSLVLSEQGIIGFSCFMMLILTFFFTFWRYRNQSPYHKMFFIGFLFNISAMASIGPQYSLFLWVFISLGSGYIFHYKIRKEENFYAEESLLQNQANSISGSHISALN